MRTADRLLAGRFVGPARNDPMTELAQEVVRAGPVLVADNVADYLGAIPPKEWVLEDAYPTLSPPWPSFWIEYHNTGSQRRGVMVLDLMRLIPQHKEDVAAMEKKAADLTHLDAALTGDSGKNAKRLAQLKAHLAAVERSREGVESRLTLLELGAAAMRDAEEQTGDPDAAWLVALVLFSEQKGRVTPPVGWWVLALDDSGWMLGNRWQMHPAVERVGWDEQRLLAALRPAFQTIAFLHCRNVKTDHVVPPSKLSRKHQRKRGGPPLVRYHTLRLVVPRRGDKGKARGPGTSPALHIVAGHFSHYGDCCPGKHEPHGKLFGRFEGKYWMPDHARGNVEQGEVITDFEMEVAE